MQLTDRQVAELIASLQHLARCCAGQCPRAENARKQIELLSHK